WPVPAILRPDGHTLVTLTHGNTVVELDKDARIVWQISNADLPGAPIKDACGAQRLPNGNTVITSYAGRENDLKLIEVDRAKKIVWSFQDGKKHGIHEFQILDTNGTPIEGGPLK